MSTHSWCFLFIHPCSFMKYTLKSDDGMDQNFFGLVKAHISWIATKLGLNMLLYSQAKHWLRGVIVHLELTDLLRGVLMGCKANHLMKQASWGSRGCQHIAPVTQQPIGAQSPCRRRSGCLLPRLDFSHIYLWSSTSRVKLGDTFHLLHLHHTGSWTGFCLRLSVFLWQILLLSGFQPLQTNVPVITGFPPVRIQHWQSCFQLFNLFFLIKFQSIS